MYFSDCTPCFSRRDFIFNQIIYNITKLTIHRLNYFYPPQLIFYQIQYMIFYPQPDLQGYRTPGTSRLQTQPRFTSLYIVIGDVPV